MHDEASAGGKAVENVTPMKTGGAGKGAPAHPMPSEVPIEDHVAEHGPAHSHTHEMEGDMHHVSSYHGDAEMGENDHPGAHHSKHKSHAAVHEHLGKALGVEDGEDNETPEEEPDEAGASSGPPLFSSGSKVPGLA